MPQIGIYRLLNSVTGKSYVGSSLDLELRRRVHARGVKNGKAHSPLLQNSFIKHGIENFAFEVLEECGTDDLEMEELTWMDAFNAINQGYNLVRDVEHPARGQVRHGTRKLVAQKVRYPINWPIIRASILERDNRQCTVCGLREFSVGERLPDGTFQLLQETASLSEGRMVAAEVTKQTGRKHIVIILACAHLENPDPQDTRPENLAMKCEYHHLKADKYLHSAHERSTRARGMPKTLSFRFPDTLVKQIETESDRRKITQSEVIREIVENYFSGDHQPRNFDVVLYEIITTRAALLRRLDMINPPELSAEQLAELLDEAGKDAAAYVEDRKKT